MPSINDSVSVLDRFFVGKHFPIAQEAYQTLKAAVLTQRADNKPSMPSPCTWCEAGPCGECLEPCMPFKGWVKATAHVG